MVSYKALATGAVLAAVLSAVPAQAVTTFATFEALPDEAATLCQLPLDQQWRRQLGQRPGRFVRHDRHQPADLADWRACGFVLVHRSGALGDGHRAHRSPDLDRPDRRVADRHPVRLHLHAGRHRRLVQLRLDVGDHCRHQHLRRRFEPAQRHLWRRGDRWSAKGGNTADFDAETALGQSLVFSSDFIDFSGVTNSAFALDLENIRSVLSALGTPPTTALRTFRTNANGSFGYDGEIIVNGIPEPQTWGLMVVGFGMIGMQVRRRNRRTAVAA